MCQQGQELFAANAVVVAVEVELVVADHIEGAFDIVGAVPGAARAVVVPDAFLDADAYIGRVAI
jgi:hypothetical protein